MVESRIFPSSPRRGGCAIKKTSRSILSSRRRGGVQPQQDSAEFDHHPVRSKKEASRYLFEVASTPPRRGGENCGTLRFGNSPGSPWISGQFEDEPRRGERFARNLSPSGLNV